MLECYFINCRINVGGWHVLGYMQRLLQLKTPPIASLLTLSRVQEIVHAHCYIASNYLETLLDTQRENIYIQVPGADISNNIMADTSEQEEKDVLRREKARKHLLRLSQKKREDKVSYSCLIFLNYLMLLHTVQ